MRLIDPQYSPSEDGGVGTEIVVTRLHESVSQDFENPLILSQLREQIRMRHQAALQEGLEIKVGSERLTGFAPTLLSGPDFHPVNRRFTITQDGGEVHCRLVAGIAASENEALDEGQAEDFRTAGDAGWWLFCNGRLLLVAERTALTGWGDNVAAYHPQYRRFRGYMYLTSLDTELLPWNTTKTGIWRNVQGQMKVALGQVVAVLNRLKTERQYGEDRDDMPVTAAVQNARPLPLGELPQASSVVAPPPPAKKASRPPKTVQRIQYDVAIDRYRKVASALGINVISEIGRRTFDYFFDREVDD
jgi:hypothetical protein